MARRGASALSTGRSASVSRLCALGSLIIGSERLSCRPGAIGIMRTFILRHGECEKDGEQSDNSLDRA